MDNRSTSEEEMRIETREAMEMLFCAKWNVPTAAKHCNLTRKEMMITFRMTDLEEKTTGFQYYPQKPIRKVK